MMKRFIFTIIFITLFFAPVFETAAQQNADESSEPLVIFDTTGFPQWARDLRRFDIVAFGTFPFSMLFVNFFYDMYRWNNANGMDFSAEGRRYAPWPLKSAGGYEKNGIEFRNTIFMAAGLSLVIAVVDIIIFKTKQRREQNRILNTPSSGSFSIYRNPPEDEDPNEYIFTED